MFRITKGHWLSGSPLSEEPDFSKDVDTLYTGLAGKRQEVTKPYG